MQKGHTPVALCVNDPAESDLDRFAAQDKEGAQQTNAEQRQCAGFRHRTGHVIKIYRKCQVAKRILRPAGRKPCHGTVVVESEGAIGIGAVSRGERSGAANGTRGVDGRREQRVKSGKRTRALPST